MKSPKELAPKPADAVTAMIEGLLSAEKRDNFEIDMKTFGTQKQDICFGCAATCAVLFLLPGIPANALYRRRIFNNVLVGEEWYAFETMIDLLRMGLTKMLFSFYGYEQIEIKLPILTTDTWQEYLHCYVQFRNDLIKQGM